MVWMCAIAQGLLEKGAINFFEFSSRAICGSFWTLVWSFQSDHPHLVIPRPLIVAGSAFFSFA
jgi:hypothetical protein